MSKFKVTYEIGAKDDLDKITTRFVTADDADLAVVQVLNQKDADGFSLSVTRRIRNDLLVTSLIKVTKQD